ncbi:MAG: Rho-binding antiterminator [Candidatus Thiodiazotropha sp. (ex Epidulcina cf. delphinae)]|nr:Rho-binding antiterminator [Candidatus Thiodiazotropha sp. (ex Epidulcina cf. delphinae)]
MILCKLYDYIEIACMYRLPVELQLKNGLVHQGMAVDTLINSDGEECMVISSGKNVESAENNRIVINQIKVMRALVSNPHFDTVTFNI